MLNCTYDEIDEGVNVETLSDFDCMTTRDEVESLEDLEREIDE